MNELIELELFNTPAEEKTSVDLSPSFSALTLFAENFQPLSFQEDYFSLNDAYSEPAEVDKSKTQVCRLQPAETIPNRPSSFFERASPQRIDETTDTEVFAAEFADTHKWRCEYQRNNRNGGMKNIRCFPFCGAKHYSTGFCGESLLVMVKTNSTARRIYAYAEIGLSYADSDKLIKVGQTLSRDTIMEKVRSRDRPFRSWWDGDLRESKESLNKETGKTESAFTFEFNRSKRGWHYGWVANKYISNMKHTVRAYIFVPVGDGNLKCVCVAASPDFTLYSRKPKTDTVNKKKIKIEKKAPKKRIGTKAGASKNQEQGRTAVLTADEWKILKRARLDIRKRRISRTDDIELGGLCESLNADFEGVDVFQVLQKILQLPPDVYNQSLSSIFSDIEKRDSSDDGNQNKALREFAKLLVSDNEDVTEAIQSKMEAFHPFEIENDDSLEDNTVNVLTTAKETFNKILAPFQVDVDAFTNPKVKSKGKRAKHGSYNQARATMVRKQIGYVNCANDTVTNDPNMSQFLSAYEGVWVRTKETLHEYDRLYTKMRIPYALKKCYLHMLEKTTIKPCKGTNSVITQYNRKLFSSGVIRYIFDGKLRPWALTPPLMSTQYDAVAFRAWIDEIENKMNIEHHFKTYKLLRSYTVDGDELVGRAILFIKSEGMDNCVEWTQLDSLKIKATKWHDK